MTYNEGDRWNGREHRPAVNNPQHADKLECAICHEPHMQRPGKKYCPKCQGWFDVVDASPAHNYIRQSER